MKTLMNAVVNIVENEDTIIMPSTTSNPIEEREALIEPCMSSPKICPQKRKRKNDEKLYDSLEQESIQNI